MATATTLVSRLPLSTWADPLQGTMTWFSQAVNGEVVAARQPRRVQLGVRVSACPPTSRAEPRGAAFVPMGLRDRLGYHVLHVAAFLPHRHRAAGFASRHCRAALICCGFAVSTGWVFGARWDRVGHHSLVACCVRASLWSGAALPDGLPVGGGEPWRSGSRSRCIRHAAFFVDQADFTSRGRCISAYFSAPSPLAAWGPDGLSRCCPVDWKSLRYPDYVSFNNTAQIPVGRLIGRGRHALISTLRFSLCSSPFDDDSVGANASELLAIAIAPGRGWRLLLPARCRARRRSSPEHLGDDGRAIFDRIQHAADVVTRARGPGASMRVAQGGDRPSSRSLPSYACRMSFAPIGCPELRAFIAH